MLYTSYYNKQLHNKKNPLYGISVYLPPYIHYPNVAYVKHLPLLAPPSSTLWRYKNGKIDEEEFKKEYLIHLYIHKDEVLNTIKSLPDESILLCHEKTGRFCHRNILAEWLKQYGIEVLEILDL